MLRFSYLNSKRYTVDHTLSPSTGTVFILQYTVSLSLLSVLRCLLTVFLFTVWCMFSETKRSKHIKSSNRILLGHCPKINGLYYLMYLIHDLLVSTCHLFLLMVAGNRRWHCPRNTVRISGGHDSSTALPIVGSEPRLPAHA